MRVLRVGALLHRENFPTKRIMARVGGRGAARGRVRHADSARGRIIAASFATVSFLPYRSEEFYVAKLGLTLWDGVFEGKQETRLKWADKDGRITPTGRERADEERRQAGETRQQAEGVRRRVGRGAGASAPARRPPRRNAAPVGARPGPTLITRSAAPRAGPPSSRGAPGRSTRRAPSRRARRRRPRKSAGRPR
jgi:hypothetical protein